MTNNSTTLRIALQKSGRLKDDSLQYLDSIGIKCEYTESSLKTVNAEQNIEFLFLREKDIIPLVNDGFADMGIVGENTFRETEYGMQDSQENYQEKTYYPLGFSNCRLCLAVPEDSNYTSIDDFDEKIIATSYPNIMKRFFKMNCVDASSRYLTGSVELMPSIGCADAILDLVETGRSLRENKLKEFTTILESQAVAIFSPQFQDIEEDEINCEGLLAFKQNLTVPDELQLAAARVEVNSSLCRTYA